ncbi:MAG TPA: hypothetical protein VKT25_11665 [Ktedonobacteraceae bacterium]|nr:hypothetical protein [Ktedonobacteraceae bacterium]
MKNPVIFYAVIVLGVIALAVGAFYLKVGGHQLREYVGLGAGVVLIIVGIVGAVMARSKPSVAR